MKKLLMLTLAATLAVSACSKKPKTDESNLPTAANADENTSGDSDNGKAMGLQTIHFAYDNYTLDSEAKSLLQGNAQVLKDKPSMKIQIEGHCDRHGGIQYNVALGEKRANAAKKFLMSQGIKGDRISIISFGKEKPVDSSETEAADAKNRRDNFVITTR